MSNLKREKDIRQRIENPLVEWKLNHFTMLVQDTVRTSRSLVSTERRGILDEKVAKTFETLVIKGKIRSAIRFAMLRDKGGVLAPGAVDEKSGKTVLEVLKGKHPEVVIPEVGALEGYVEVPELVPVDVTGGTVVEVAAKLSGAGDPGAVDAVDAVDAVGRQQWLLWFGPEIQAL